MAAAPSAAMMDRQRATISSRASSHDMRAKRPSPLAPVRRSGWSNRSGLYTRSRYRSTLTQRWRPVTGWVGFGATATARPSRTVTSIAQASGQSCVHVTRTIRVPGSAMIPEDSRSSLRSSDVENPRVVALIRRPRIEVPLQPSAHPRDASSGSVTAPLPPRIADHALLGAELSQRTEPVFEMVGPGNLAVLDGLDVDRHDPEALSGMRYTKEVPRRCSGDLAPDDDTIPRDQNFLDLESHVGDRLCKASDHLDRRITAPAFAGQITPTGFIVRSEHLFLQCFHITLDGLVEQAVPRSNDGTCLRLRQTLCRGGHGAREQTRDDGELKQYLHGDLLLGATETSQI